MLRATTACTFSTSQLPKVVRTWCVLHILISKCASRHNGVALFRHLKFQKWSENGVLHILTWKCASRHNDVHFFNISTSKSGPNPSIFNTLYFQMCFAPQRCALFQHLNFLKWSEPVNFLHILLPNVLRATTACNFSSLISQMSPHPPL